jgi:hypothetical protein
MQGSPDEMLIASGFVLFPGLFLLAAWGAKASFPRFTTPFTIEPRHVDIAVFFGAHGLTSQLPDHGTAHSYHIPSIKEACAPDVNSYMSVELWIRDVNGNTLPVSPESVYLAAGHGNLHDVSRKESQLMWSESP